MCALSFVGRDRPAAIVGFQHVKVVMKKSGVTNIDIRHSEIDQTRKHFGWNLIIKNGRDSKLGHYSKQMLTKKDPARFWDLAQNLPVTAHIYQQ